VNENPSGGFGLTISKDELLAKIETEWTAFVLLISKISSEKMRIPAFGGWSVKDILAHTAAWERFMCLHYIHNQPAYEALQMDSEEFNSLDEDGLNARLYERYRDRSLTEIRAMSHECHEQVLRDMDGMSFETMIASRVGGERPGELLLAGIAANTYEHYREHRESIEKHVESSW